MRVRAALAIAILAFFGCKPKQEPPPEASALASASAGPTPQASIATSEASPALASALVDIRENALPISAPREASQRLAFGRGVLAELSADGLRVRSVQGPERDVRIDLRGGRALLALPSGALLAIGTEAVYRLDPDADKLRPFKRVVFFPDSELLPERSDEQFFWVVHRSTKTALKYKLEPSELPMLLTAAETTLEGFDGRAIAMARDGVFVYSTESGIARHVAGGKTVIFKPPAGSSGKPIWRILLATRLDQLWVISEDGDVELWTLFENAPLVRKFRLALPPYEAVATTEALAFVTITQERGKSRRFAALVYDAKGTERFRVDLPNDRATASDDWLSSVTQNKGIAASDEQNKLVVGGPTWLGIWDLRTGARLSPP